MDSYAQFSHFYDRLMGDRSDVIRLVNKSVHEHFPGATSLLELGSGSGSILKGLSSFYEVEGLDISQSMLRLSQRKLPTIRHHLGDMTSFELEKRYDVIICVFDSINHLLTPEQWQSTFRSAAKHLNTGGLFLFDTLTTGRLRSETIMPTYQDAVPGGEVEMDTIASGHDRVTHHIVFQEPQSDGAVQVFEQELDEATFPLAIIEGWLAEDFVLIDTFTADGSAPSDRSGRVYYACRKPLGY